MFDDKSYNSAYKSTKVISVNGDIYDSFTEFRFKELLEMNNVQYKHNDYRIETPRKRGGAYKADFIIPTIKYNTKKYDIIDIKGKAFSRDDNAQELAKCLLEVFKNKTTYPNSLYNAFILVYKDHIQYYDENTEKIEGDVGHFYKCPRCGNFEIKSKRSPRCYKCGSTMKRFLDDDKWIDYLIDNADEGTLRKHNEFEEKALSRLYKVAKEANIALLPSDKIYQIEHPDRQHLVFTPDAAYFIHPDTLTVYNTASKLQSVIYAIDMIENDQHLIDDLVRHAGWKESAIGQAVLLTQDGIKVAERDGEGLGDGAAFTCDKCGKGYFAREDNADCPFCGSNKHTKKTK